MDVSKHTLSIPDFLHNYIENLKANISFYNVRIFHLERQEREISNEIRMMENERNWSEDQLNFYKDVVQDWKKTV